MQLHSRTPPMSTPARQTLEENRDLALLVGAVALCATAGLLALIALVAGPETTWWIATWLVAALAIGGCLAAHRRRHDLNRIPADRADRPSDVT